MINRMIYYKLFCVVTITCEVLVLQPYATFQHQSAILTRILFSFENINMFFFIL